MTSLDDVQRDLLAWGLIERGERGLGWTRRFRGAVMREAARLAEEERAGRAPAGPPLLTAVAGALAALTLPAPASEQHARFLYAVELTSLPDGLREALGDPARGA